MQTDKKTVYAIRLLYVPKEYDETKNKDVKIIGNFNSWYEQTCLYDKSLGIYYHILKTDDLMKPISFKFVSPFVGKCGNHLKHYECSTLYSTKKDEEDRANNFLDIANLNEEKGSKSGEKGGDGSKKMEEIMKEYNQFLNDKIKEAIQDDKNQEIKYAKSQSEILEEPIFFIPENKDELYARCEKEGLKICSMMNGNWYVGSYPVEKRVLQIDEKVSIEIYCAKFQRY